MVSSLLTQTTIITTLAVISHAANGIAMSTIGAEVGWFMQRGTCGLKGNLGLLLVT